MAQDNPFRKAVEDEPSSDASRLKPLRRGEIGNPSKIDKLRTIQDLGIVEAAVIAKNPRVATLTVRDLEDLASEFSGVPTGNRAISDLSVEDIQDIEGIFFEYKLNVGRDIAGGVTDLAAVDISCCCTTPCCCCAAADVDPIAS